MKNWNKNIVITGGLCYIMEYPTQQKIDAASKEQLGRWIRFLPSPGMAHIGSMDFETNMQHEIEILNRIIKLFNDSGGWTPELSKKVGWI